MPNLKLIKATTDAANGGSAILPADSATFHLGTHYNKATLSADNLATTEEVDIFIGSGSSWKTYDDTSGNPITLTATVHQITIETPGLFGVTKDATAGACGVSVALSLA